MAGRNASDTLQSDRTPVITYRNLADCLQYHMNELRKRFRQAVSKVRAAQVPPPE